LIQNTEHYEDWIEYVADRPFNDKRYYMSNQKVKDLGWEIKTNFVDGIQGLIYLEENLEKNEELEILNNKLVTNVLKIRKCKNEYTNTSDKTRKIILICATGRSGSTTLQRIINTIDDSNINGENCGAINDLLNCYHNIKKTNNYKITNYIEGKTKIKPAFYNCYNFENVKNNIKNTILSIITCDLSKRVIGFKEIRYCHNIHLINEFIELFSNTKIICHIDDNIDRQCKSGWWTESSKEHLIEYNDQMIKYSKDNKNCYLSYMKNLFEINEMKKMFNFLGEEFDENKYNYIINNNLK
jgi:hypothetical protein